MTDAFSGFSQDFFSFFEELVANNNRAWFEDNKPRYRGEVQAELSSFVASMQPRLADFAPHFVADPRPHGGSIFRIYRDQRFSRGGKSYKENAGCHFRHSAGKDAHAPGYYVHLEPGKVFVGGGIWKPPSPALRKIRERIVARPGDWEQVVTDPALVARFGAVDGDSLSRPPRGFAADVPWIEDIKRTTFFVIRHMKPGDAMSPAFEGEVVATLRDAAPLMAFLCASADQPF